MLRTNLEVALAELEHPTVIITSANAGEGKTATCGQLAQVLAQAGRRVVMVDLDLRHPDVHNWLGGENIRGVTDILLDRCTVEEALQYVTITGPRQATWGLYLLSAGPVVANPAEALGSRRLARVLDGLSKQADVVLLDTPPVLPVADTLVVGRMVAGALLVVEARKTPLPAIHATRDRLIRNQTRLLGVVVNKMQAKDGEYGYGYAYGYGYGYSDSLPTDVRPNGSEGGDGTSPSVGPGTAPG